MVGWLNKHSLLQSSTVNKFQDVWNNITKTVSKYNKVPEQQELNIRFHVYSYDCSQTQKVSLVYHIKHSGVCSITCDDPEGSVK